MVSAFQSSLKNFLWNTHRLSAINILNRYKISFEEHLQQLAKKQAYLKKGLFSGVIGARALALLADRIGPRVGIGLL